MLMNLILLEKSIRMNNFICGLFFKQKIDSLENNWQFLFCSKDITNRKIFQLEDLIAHIEHTTIGRLIETTIILLYFLSNKTT